MARIEPLLTNPKLHLTYCRLTDIHTLLSQRQKWGPVDLVAHLGLYVPQGHSFYQQCTEDITLNVLPTMNLIKSLGDSIQGICFASSVAVYGCPARLPVKESDLPNPISSYAATKLAIEGYLRAYGSTSQVPVTILRYSTVYGPGELEHRAIPSFLRSLSKGQPPQIYGDGSEIRDYVYIDDVIQATISALVRKPVHVLNIGSGRGYTTLHIAREFIRLCSADVEPQFIPRKGQNINLTCDISAAQKALGYTPQTSLEDGLTKEIQWYNKEVRGKLPKDENRHVSISGNKREVHHWFAYLHWKGIIDRVLAFLGIVILSPLLALISMGIRLDSPGSPIFSQERVGKDGRRFKVYKFRSMHTNGDDGEYRAYLHKYVLENAPYRLGENGQSIYKVDDSQVTKFGALLRKTNLDELPQLINVLKGEMSCIGPRPDVPFSVAMYKDWHRKRLGTKPGITGLWQVSGRKGLSFEDMVRLDIDYIKKQSLILDTKILLQTIGTILGRDGS